MIRAIVAPGLLLAVGVLAIVLAQPDGRPSGVRACGPAGPYDFDTWEAEDYIEVYSRAIELAAYGRIVQPPFADEPPPPSTPPPIEVPSPIVLDASTSPTESTTAQGAGGTPTPEGSMTPEPTATASATETASPTGEESEGEALAQEADFTYQGVEVGPRGDRTPKDRSMVVPPAILKSIAWIEANWANASSEVPWGAVGPILRSFDCGYGLGQITSGMRNQDGTASPRQALIGTHPYFNLAEGVRILADKWNSAPEHRPVAGDGNPFALEDWYYAIWSYNGFAETNHPLNPFRDPLRGDVYHCWNEDAPNIESGFGYGDYTYPERVYGCMRHPPSKFIGDDRVFLWDPVEFYAPALGREEVAAAFELVHYQQCADDGFSHGCADMDYPTILPAIHDPENEENNQDAILVHTDPTHVQWDAPLLAQSVAPDLRVSGDGVADIEVTGDEHVVAAELTVTNIGGGIGPFRIVSSVPWLYVRNAHQPWLDPGAFRTLDGGVAIGTNMQVLSSAGYQQGHSPRLEVVVAGSQLPAGVSSGSLTVEPLMGGQPFTVTVTATGTQSPAPGPGEPTIDAMEHRAIVPGAVRSD